MKDIKENAQISLVNNQSGGGESEKIEFISGGNFYEKDGVFHITYKEHSEMGMGDSRVFLKVEENRVTMRRMGEFQTTMYYDPDRITEFLYRVPYGEMSIKIKTEKVCNKLSENGGYVRFSYVLIMDGGEIHNDITLDVKPERN